MGNMISGLVITGVSVLMIAAGVITAFWLMFKDGIEVHYDE